MGYKAGKGCLEKVFAATVRGARVNSSGGDWGNPAFLGPWGLPCEVLIPRCFPSTCPRVTAALHDASHPTVRSQWPGSISPSPGLELHQLLVAEPGESSASIQEILLQ